MYNRRAAAVAVAERQPAMSNVAAANHVFSPITLAIYERRVDRFCNWLQTHRPLQYNAMTRMNGDSRVLWCSSLDAAVIEDFLRPCTRDTRKQYLSALTWAMEASIRKKRYNGIMLLTVLFARARKRAIDRLYCPEGKGYAICKRRFTEMANDL